MITEEENFEYNLRNFLKWLEVLAMDPIKQCNAWGNCNVAWELTTDLNADGNFIINSPYSYLDQNQKNQIDNFLTSLKNIPRSVLVSATSAAANQEAMSHPCWPPFRKRSSELIHILETANTRNKIYFTNLKSNPD
jgi:hypothetical protein